jgi:ADP-L-glycero-D-manno-heptose 6-epimerase
LKRRVIFVTGAAGFIGSNIVARLSRNPDYDVVACDRLRGVETGKWRNLAKSPIADFVSPDCMFDWLERNAHQVCAVVHMGAVSSTMEPDADHIVHSNFTLSRDLHRWCAEHQRRMIYASSAATYGAAEAFVDDNSIAGLEALRPLNAYGWSKTLFDLYAAREAARNAAPSQWAGLKFFNVYGPNEGHKGTMKSVAAQIYPKVAAGEGVSLFSSHNPAYADGGQLRDFVYVRDVVDVVEWLLENDKVSGIFNLGSGQARSFRELAEAVFTAAGKPANISYRPMPEEIRDRYQYFTQADMNRIRSVGYEGQFTSLEAGVSDYVKGYLAQQDPFI